jgi:molybdopterin synthase catalytic subunit
VAIKVRFFARLKEECGRAEAEIAYRPGLGVAEVWAAATGGKDMPESVLVAINMEYARGSVDLRDGDEVAFFPPVTGGQNARVEIRGESFDPYAEIAVHEKDRGAQGSIGATAVFIGTMRDFNDGLSVESMVLEHYPGMTERHLAGICAEAAKRWPIQDCLVLHRAGEIRVGEPIVLVAIWSAHRGEALDACRFIIEDLKARAPFWKQERSGERVRWVEQNTSGYAGRPRAAGTDEP